MVKNVYKMFVHAHIFLKRVCTQIIACRQTDLDFWVLSAEYVNISELLLFFCAGLGEKESSGFA